MGRDVARAGQLRGKVRAAEERLLVALGGHTLDKEHVLVLLQDRGHLGEQVLVLHRGVREGDLPELDRVRVDEGHCVLGRRLAEQGLVARFDRQTRLHLQTQRLERSREAGNDLQDLGFLGAL